MSKKILVAYFSCSGVTAEVAKVLAECAQADLFEIVPEVPYTKADLDWRDKNSRSTVEMNDPAARPAIAGVVDNFSDYETFFVGFPIWWGTAPSIIATFLESYDFNNKTIVPFATSGSSGYGKTDAGLKDLCPGNITWRPGKALNGKPDKSRITEWIKSLGL